MQPTLELTLHIVDAITEYQAQHGYPLSILELASICKVSAGVMYRLLLKMEQQGIIEMPLRQARSIRVADAESIAHRQS